MSDKGWIGALVAGALGLARELVSVWREKEPTPREADRTDADALAEAVKRDAGDGLAVMRDQIVGERSRR